jgi:cytochrome c nitrite reductase small subunit
MKVEVMRFWSLITLEALPSKLRLACFASIGAFVGMSAYVFNLSNASSYLSDDPGACINCHIMTPMYASWQHSSHGRVTNCNDCHVPHDSLARKYWFKATDGMRHSVMFTLRMEPQVFRARDESKKVIQANCIRCHTDQVHSATTLPKFSRSCVECHREVPHGRVDSLSSTPNAAVPLPSPVFPNWFSKEKSQNEEE